MVTVLLSGGLGNQMFQYAAAKALAARLNTSVAFDIYSLTKKKTAATIRNYELGIFNIDIPLISTLKGRIFVKAHPYIHKRRLFFQRFGFLTDTIAILYQPVVETIEGNIIMAGNFQNERYFKNIESEIRADFTFRNPLSGKNLEISEIMAMNESVAIHVRRGDYISNSYAASNFISGDKSYYEDAIGYIADKVKNPAFYVFSDDMDWAKENLGFNAYPVTYIDWNTADNSYIDMQLMSLCKHNVIANSSFSWWGAWLNRNPDKVVVAPGKWFKDENKNILLDDFLPNGWVKM